MWCHLSYSCRGVGILFLTYGMLSGLAWNTACPLLPPERFGSLRVREEWILTCGLHPQTWRTRIIFQRSTRVGHGCVHASLLLRCRLTNSHFFSTTPPRPAYEATEDTTTAIFRLI